MEESAKPAELVLPLGIFPGRTDDKGRLKLPVDIERWLAANGDKETGYFATSFDERIARIYPISEWKKTEKLLQESGEDAVAGEDLWFTAMDLGGMCSIDAQGRIVLPPTLRRTLGLENVPCHLEWTKGFVNIFNDEVYEERKQRSRENREAKLAAFKRKGL